MYVSMHGYNSVLISQKLTRADITPVRHKTFEIMHKMYSELYNYVLKLHNFHDD